MDPSSTFGMRTRRSRSSRECIPKIVQAILTQARIEATLDLYSDVLLGMDQQAIRKLDSLLRTAPPAHD